MNHGHPDHVRKKKLSHPVAGMAPSEHPACDALLKAYGDMSFQARTLSQAADVLCKMVRDAGTLKVLTLAGALIPGGVKRVLMEMLTHRLFDVVISTGANISHDFVEGMGRYHYRHCGFQTDPELREQAVNRVYDSFIAEDDFRHAARALWARVGEIAGVRTSREVTHFLAGLATTPCLLTAARDAGVPVYVPALNDSECGMSLSAHNAKAPQEQRVFWDGLGDNLEFARLFDQHTSHGILICGGGVPRNWAQQVTPLLEYLQLGKEESARHEYPGYKYGIHITTDTPVYGGMSGCTFSESISWGKYDPDANAVTVNCDITIALPLIAAAAIERLKQAKAPE